MKGDIMQSKHWLALIGIVIVTTACSSMLDVISDDSVITTMDNVKPGATVTVIPEEDLPVSVASNAPLGSTIVSVDEDDVVDPTEILSGGNGYGGSKVESLIDSAFGIGKAFFPWLAAWEGVLTLLFKRKRQHYKAALTKLVPGNGFSIPSALNSMVAGMGMKHTAEVEPAPKAPAV